jgi:hypothetical protein
MNKSNNLSIYLLFTLLLCTSFRCEKEEIDYKYNFIEDIKLFPAQKNYKVGDTIWLEYSNPDKKLFDKLNGQNISVDTVTIGFQVSFNIRYGVQFIPAEGLCDYITPNGINVGRNLGPGNGTGLSYSFGCNNNNSYDFKIGVVPKVEGIFSLDLLGQPENVAACASRIGGFPLSTIAYKFGLADCNKDIYLTIPLTARLETTNGYTERKIESKEVYIVRVE